jgi:hypothetical protein
MIKRNGQKTSFGKLGGKRPLGKPRRRWEVNVKMGLWDVELESVDLWIRFFWVRLGTGGELLWTR